MDETFIASIVMDIVRGMTYLHKNSSISVHGNLKSSNCLVTSRWVVKLSGFGLPEIRNKFKEDRGKTTLLSSVRLILMDLSVGLLQVYENSRF